MTLCAELLSHPRQMHSLENGIFLGRLCRGATGSWHSSGRQPGMEWLLPRGQEKEKEFGLAGIASPD